MCSMYTRRMFTAGLCAGSRRLNQAARAACIRLRRSADGARHAGACSAGRGRRAGGARAAVPRRCAVRAPGGRARGRRAGLGGAAARGLAARRRVGLPACRPLLRHAARALAPRRRPPSRAGARARAWSGKGGHGVAAGLRTSGTVRGTDRGAHRTRVMTWHASSARFAECPLAAARELPPTIGSHQHPAAMLRRRRARAGPPRAGAPRAPRSWS